MPIASLDAPGPFKHVRVAVDCPGFFDWHAIGSEDEIRRILSCSLLDVFFPLLLGVFVGVDNSAFLPLGADGGSMS